MNQKQVISWQLITYKLTDLHITFQKFKNRIQEAKNIKGIIYAEDLARELLKHPRAYVCAGKNGADTYREDRKIMNVFLRDGDTLVLDTENYDENGLLKYYEQVG